MKEDSGERLYSYTLWHRNTIIELSTHRITYCQWTNTHTHTHFRFVIVFLKLVSDCFRVWVCRELIPRMCLNRVSMTWSHEWKQQTRWCYVRSFFVESVVCVVYFSQHWNQKILHILRICESNRNYIQFFFEFLYWNCVLVVNRAVKHCANFYWNNFYGVGLGVCVEGKNRLIMHAAKQCIFCFVFCSLIGRVKS